MKPHASSVAISSLSASIVGYSVYLLVVCSAGEGASTSTSRASRRPHVSTDSDSSGRASR